MINKSRVSRLWKWAFIVLAVINIGTIAVIGNRMMTKRDETVLKNVKIDAKATKIGEISATTAQVNDLINTYLEDFNQSKNNPLDFKFYVADKAVLEGTYKFFSIDVPLYVYFEPLALEDGSIELKVSDVSVGALPLPASTVLSYVKSAVKKQLPDFITIAPSKKIVKIDIQKVKFAGGMFAEADKVDLLNGKFVFEIYQK
jgi:uncharacterized protein YpmS